MLTFDIEEGSTQNCFYRSEELAVHVLTGRRPAPRVIVASPAGNAGAGLWGARGDDTSLRVDGPITPIRRGDLRGAEVVVKSDQGELTIERCALGNIRMLRNVDMGDAVPSEFAASSTIEDEHTLVLSRRSLDDAHDYELRVRVEGGTIEELDGGRVRLRAPAPLRFHVTALSSAEPLAILEPDELLNASAGDDPRAREVLQFLSYRDKLCAGSWRFLTYFGRDTLLTLRLLMPVLAEEAIEAGLASVLDRLSPEGRVAHEEELGEWSLYCHGHAPSFDYTMVDDDFMLAPLAARYLVADSRGQRRAESFLGRASRQGPSYKQLLARNLRWVHERAQPYAGSRRRGDLIRITAGSRVGNWRDSQTGLAGGTYPWDVNVALLPAALEASEALASLLGDADLPGAEARRAARAAWSESSRHFEVAFDRDEAAAAIAAYAARYGLDPAPASEALGESLRFAALALRDDGSPVPVMHSDVGYRLIFATPPADELAALVDLVRRPFPAGLGTPIGIPISNPAMASAEEESGLTPGHYHGAAMWPWQHAMWILGLREQAERADLDDDLRRRMRATADELRASSNIDDLRTAELWTWSAEGGALEAVPFGQGEDHHAESNAAQLWSTIDLVLSYRGDA